MATTSTSRAKSDPVPVRPNPFRSWWWLLLVPVALGAAFLFRPADEQQKKLDTRREAIANMTVDERQRIKENFERFQQMSPEQQEALREIAEAVGEDKNLEDTLYKYERWLGTLSPWERVELRKAGTADERLAYVGTLVAAQRQAELEEREWLKRFSEDATRYMMTFQWPGARQSSHRRIPEEEIPGMMAVLDAEYGPGVKLSKNVSQGCAAYNLQLLAEALKAGIEQNGLDKAREQPLPKETIDQMIEQLKDNEDRKLLRELLDDWKATWFVRWLNSRLERAWWSEASENPASREDLEKLARDIGGEFLSKYEETKNTRGSRDAYKLLLFATRPAYFYADSEDLNKVMVELKLREKRKKLDLRWPGWGWGRSRGDYRSRGRDRGSESRREVIEPARAERAPRQPEE